MAFRFQIFCFILSSIWHIAYFQTNQQPQFPTGTPASLTTWELIAPTTILTTIIPTTLPKGFSLLTKPTTTTTTKTTTTITTTTKKTTTSKTTTTHTTTNSNNNNTISKNDLTNISNVTTQQTTTSNNQNINRNYENPYSMILIYQNQSDLLKDFDFDNNTLTQQVQRQISMRLNISANQVSPSSDIIASIGEINRRLRKRSVTTEKDVVLHVDLVSDSKNQTEIFESKLNKSNITLGLVTLLDANARVWLVHGPCPRDECKGETNKCGMIRDSNGTYALHCVKSLLTQPVASTSDSPSLLWLLFLLLIIPIVLICCCVYCIFFEKNEQNKVYSQNQDIMSVIKPENKLSMNSYNNGPDIIINPDATRQVSQDTTKSKFSSFTSKMSKKVFDNKLFKDENDVGNTFKSHNTITSYEETTEIDDGYSNSVHVENMF